MAAFGGAAWPPGRVARLARWPRIALCRTPNRKGQSVPMKGVRINEIWYKYQARGQPDIQSAAEPGAIKNFQLEVPSASAWGAVTDQAKTRHQPAWIGSSFSLISNAREISPVTGKPFADS